MSRNNFWEGETYAIVKAMRRTGNQEGVVARWKKSVERWALNAVNEPDAAAVRAWLPMWQVRPFYTVDELAPMWPALAIGLGIASRWPNVPKSTRRLEFELDYAGLPHFVYNGKRYFIVERLHYWRDASPKEIEKEFENVCS